MVFLVILIIVIAIILIYLWIKVVNAVFNPIIRRLEKKDNPYIQAHRVKMYNDKMYSEYLVWLDKNGGDIPFEKWKVNVEGKLKKSKI